MEMENISTPEKDLLNLTQTLEAERPEAVESRLASFALFPLSMTRQCITAQDPQHSSFSPTVAPLPPCSSLFAPTRPKPYAAVQTFIKKDHLNGNSRIVYAARHHNLLHKNANISGPSRKLERFDP